MTARDSHAADFTAFARACQHRMLRVAYLVCGDRHLAEDLLQDALVKLALRWPKVSAGNPEAFLRTVLYRDAVSHWRSRRREVIADPPPRAAGRDDRVEDRLVFAAALDRLTRKQRAVLVLRFYEDLPDREIAEALGCREATVRSNASRALATLRTRLSETEEARP